ncbi:restriction endonuclease subunit S [Faecalibacterium sp. An77]|uniref:restriction endonuclease subunit S n=1 Tax=Faecalibacterium sp. An77 TaxID=1965655 RepID=UPI000B3A8FEE|nr:restriction endonuclease subunit S [Faecalibacterium sp. An77]OUN38968.1 restriction endonuclease subunit S [Faecalibacterium sp. An77]
MSKLEELIQQLCPDGVECRNLEECCNILDKKRKPVTKAAREAGEYRYYGANGIQDYVSDYIFDGTFVLVGEDGSVITKAGTPVVTWAEGKIWVNNHAHIIEEKTGVLLRYLFHYIQTIDVTSLIHGNIPKLTGGDFKTLKISIPPLEIQREIVRILDHFTELTTELTAELTVELTARQKQYEYYRDRLLIQGDKVVWMTLGDIGKVSMCKRIMKAETSSQGEVPFFKIGTFGKEPDAYITREKFEEYCEKYSFPKKGDVLISAAGTIGRTVIYDGKPAYYQDSNIVWLDNDESKVLNKYLYYYYQLQPWAVSTGGTIARLYNDNISKAKIAVPPLDEQHRIVSILDRFDALCNDLTSGLPAEIAARQKQYEYYRDKLLTFNKERLF